MIHRKIYSGRVQSNGSSTLNYKLDASPGGRACKVILWSIKVIQASDNVTLGLGYSQGPDGDVFGSTNSVITQAAPSTVPSLMEGASGTPDTVAADVLNEWIRPEVDCGVSSGTADEWAMIEVWETRKPF